MNPHGDDLTPTKSVSRVSLSPKSKESICILCAESVLNVSFRRRLFTRSTKSPACVNLEILVGAKLVKESCSTEIICKNCARSNENVVKKVLGIREQFASSQQRLAADCGSIESVKRQTKDSDVQVSTKRKVLLFGETSNEPIPLVMTTEKSTQTLSWPEDSDMSAVYVSRSKYTYFKLSTTTTTIFNNIIVLDIVIVRAKITGNGN